MADHEQFKEAAHQLEEAARAKKCWPCGCFHGALEGIERAVPGSERPNELEKSLRLSRAKRQAVKYDCLGCEICWPALALNALQIEGDACATANVAARVGWPPYPGDYSVVRYNAPVAVCTLTDDALMKSIGEISPSGLSVVGMLQTENLGIERVINNVLANPNIRFLIVCGADSRRLIGHLPGQSLVSLHRHGVDDGMQIRDAQGKRPRLRNVPREAVEHFLRTVEVIDLVGQSNLPEILGVIDECSHRHPGPADSYAIETLVKAVAGYLPVSMTSDPAGYFVITPDQTRRLISLEHYQNDGVLDAVIEGGMAAELYTAAIDMKLISRLDHAAYLGRELARAENALIREERYVQDAAPEQQSSRAQSACGCHPIDKEHVT